MFASEEKRPLNPRRNNPSTQSELFPAVLSRAAGSGANRACQLSRLNAELLQLVVPKTHPGRLRAGSQGMSVKDDWTLFPLHFRHFPLVFSPRAA